MHSKRYESTDVDRRTWLHVPLRLTGPPAVTLTKYIVEIQIETFTKMYTPFLNRIELTTWTICAFRVLNPRSVILSQTGSLKSCKVMTKKVPIQVLSQKGWCNKPKQVV